MNLKLVRPQKIFLWISLLALFALGFVIRLYDMGDPPLDFNPTRQLHSALMARGMYYQDRADLPNWQRQTAVEQWKKEGLIEPPILEALTAFTYRFSGENLIVPRLYSIFFWMLAGLALYLLARDLAGELGALLGLAYYLILPFGAIASRAFQPDPLTVALTTGAWWTANRWYRLPGWRSALLAGILGGLAIFAKTTAVFFVGGAWIGLVLWGPGIKKALRDRQVWVIAALCVLPYILFYIYGIYISGELQSQFSLRFFPQLWIDPVFYLRWVNLISSTAGFEWTVLAFLACLAVNDKAQRAMLLCIWAGYLIYGLTLPYHISTHDYYQLPLIPLVALGLAVGAQHLINLLRGPRWLVYPVVLAVVLGVVVLKAWDVRVTLKRDDYRQEISFWKKLGDKLGPGADVIGLTHDYGYRLAYWGWVNSDSWMTSGDFNYRELAGQTYEFDQLFADKVAAKDYFVITLFGELDHQPALKKTLETRYPVFEKSDDYIIYDLRHPLPSAGTKH
jgi:hypothetical protein